ncbi:unnamed protein product [Paramecium sonneborni]|uniref:Transmembrane protein n=1 Tax=Paramecium sonneborni TaxID=65129 RepID=A0A8S1Q396_9CILI|nr:unnamed protein product [Paramecium sonneborni]
MGIDLNQRKLYTLEHPKPIDYDHEACAIATLILSFIIIIILAGFQYLKKENHQQIQQQPLQLDLFLDKDQQYLVWQKEAKQLDSQQQMKDEILPLFLLWLLQQLLISLLLELKKNHFQTLYMKFQLIISQIGNQKVGLQFLNLAGELVDFVLDLPLHFFHSLLFISTFFQWDTCYWIIIGTNTRYIEITCRNSK